MTVQATTEPTPEPTSEPAAPASSSRWAWVTLLVCAVVLAVAAPVDRARSSTRLVTTVVTVVPTAAPARDCDVGFAQCTVVAVRASALAAVARHFVRATVVDSYARTDGARIDSELIQVRTSTQVLVSVQSRCAGGSGSVPDRVYGDTAVTGPARRVFIGGGRNGCSVAVTLDAPAGVAVPVAAATALAHDPAVALR